jgi:hypothetical protein
MPILFQEFGMSRGGKALLAEHLAARREPGFTRLDQIQ